MKESINPFDYAAHILTSLRSGVLLTSGAGNRVNTMTIGWGFMGIDWNLPIFATLVRTGRYTRELLDLNPEFTVNVPMGNFDRKILGVAGTKSGRDMDKISVLGITLERGEKVSVPAIRQFPLTLECQVIYRKQQDPQAIPAEIRNVYHPADIDSSAPGINRDFHIVYYGAILAAYIIK
ncbi:MAG: flavin reductase [Desulfovibrio sp.]|nr:flavin reductase [Desulfovibrio sp.]